jgi:hypothetical protein
VSGEDFVEKKEYTLSEEDVLKILNTKPTKLKPIEMGLFPRDKNEELAWAKRVLELRR